MKYCYNFSDSYNEGKFCFFLDPCQETTEQSALKQRITLLHPSSAHANMIFSFFSEESQYTQLYHMKILQTKM